MAYPMYQEYQSSTMPWFDEIPLHWCEVRLKWTLESGCKNGIWGAEPNGIDDILCIRVADFDRKQFKLRDDKLTIRAIEHKDRNGRLLRSGDLLLEKSGGGEGQLVGAVSQYTFTSEAVCSNFIASMRADEKYDSRYLTYLHAHLYSSKVNYRSIKQTTGIQNLDSQQYFDEVVFVATFEEQQKIAAFLDYKTGQIDQLIEKKKVLIEKLEEKRIAVITQAVTKGLDKNAKLKPSGVDWLGDVPEHWRVMQFKDRCRVVSGQVDPTESDYEHLPLIAPDHIEKNSGRIIALESAKAQGAISGKYLFQEGDVLYSKIRPELNKLCIAPGQGLCSADMYAIRTEEGLLSLYLFFMMLSKYYFQYAVLESMRVAMPKINRESLGAFKILVPPADEQEKIIKHITNELNTIEKSIDVAKRSISTLEEYRSAIITSAVTGKIDVREVEISKEFA